MCLPAEALRWLSPKTARIQRCGIKKRGNLIPPNARPYRCGSILLFQRDDGRYVLHRLLRLPPDGRLLMNKDAQTSTEQIRPEQVLAADSDILRNKPQFFVMDGIFDYIPFHG